MAIRIASIESLPLPPSVKSSLVSLSGGWSATPDSGGIITLSGNATFVETKGTSSPVQAHSSTIDLGRKIGTNLIITGYSESKFIGYVKKSVSFTDKLGAIMSNRSPSRAKKPLVMCVNRELGATQRELISRLLNILNISAAFPRTGSQTFFEPVWAKDNQALASLLNEMLVNTGCIMYCTPTGIIQVYTIGQFFAGLSGTSNSNTLSSTTYYDGGPGPDITNFVFRGSTQSSDKLNNPPDTTLNIAGRSSEYTKITGETKIDVEEFFEVSTVSAINNAASNINECYPIDTGRITKRVTTESLSNKSWMGSVWESARADYYNSCNLEEDSWPTVFAGGGFAWIPIKSTIETWTYNTDATTISSSDAQKASKTETVTYNSEETSNLYLSNQAEATLGLGVNFSEYLDPEDNGISSVAVYFDSIWDEAIGSFTSLEKEIIWTRPIGSYKWSGKETIRTGRPTTDFNARRGKIEQLKLKLDQGKITVDDVPSFIRTLAPYTDVPHGTTETEGHQRADWNPEYSVFPAQEKIVTQPWMSEESSLGNEGEVLSLDGGIYMKQAELQPISREITEARKKRMISMSVTNINELFTVGDIDAPSFSLDVDGVTTSGVYLNG